MTTWLPGKADTSVRQCFCVGPQGGQPLCPCMMAAKAAERRALEQEMIEQGWTPPKWKRPKR